MHISCPNSGEGTVTRPRGRSSRERPGPELLSGSPYMRRSPQRVVTGQWAQQVAGLGVEDLAFWHGARDRRAEPDAAEQTVWRSVAARGRSGRIGRGGGG